MDVSSDLAIWVSKPASPPVDVSLRVSALTDMGTAEGVPETTITLATDDGKLRQSVTTDAYGVANFETLPGLYNVAICPNPGSDHASFMGSIEFTAGDLTPEIELSKRISISGRVLNASGTPVSSGKIFLHRAASNDTSKTALVTPAPFSVEVHEDGSFVASVDRGTYRLRIVPGPENDAPPLSLPNIDIEWDQELNIQLPPLDLVHLRVLNPEGLPVPDVSVELYVQAGSAEAVDLLSVTSTNDHGGATLLTPLLD